MKKNNKGFALLETLVVSVFVMGIFSIIYVNFFPMMGEYEERERFDDIDSVYNAYLIKKYMEKNCIFPSVTGNSAYKFNLTTFNQGLVKSLGIKELYFVSQYYLGTSSKLVIKDNLSSDLGMRDYVNSLPNFDVNQYSQNGRIIVRFERTVNNENSRASTFSTYATIGIKKC